MREKFEEKAKKLKYWDTRKPKKGTYKNIKIDSKIAQYPKEKLERLHKKYLKDLDHYDRLKYVIMEDPDYGEKLSLLSILIDVKDEKKLKFRKFKMIHNLLNK